MALESELNGDELVDRLAAGDREALAEAYAEHAQGVFETALRLTASESDAEDVVHDVFLRLPEIAGSYRAEGSFGAWLRRVAVRSALMLLRKRRLRAELPLDAPGPRPVDPRDLVSGLTLERALRRLPASLRSAFVLKEIEGFTHREVAAELGISEAASQKRLSRAYARLREALGD